MSKRWCIVVTRLPCVRISTIANSNGIVRYDLKDLYSQNTSKDVFPVSGHGVGGKGGAITSVRLLRHNRGVIAIQTTL